jgi:Zn finger protein HypA/HybF involved in hydrogenase expression
VVATIEKRVGRLEQSLGGGPDECPRCSGTQVIIGVSKEITVIKDQARLTPEASLKFHHDELLNGICPLCEGQRQKIVVGWGPHR